MIWVLLILVVLLIIWEIVVYLERQKLYAKAKAFHDWADQAAAAMRLKAGSLPNQPGGQVPSPPPDFP